jgi:glutaredoxin-related protein/predicted GNAT family acetyltransferase
MAEIRYNYEKEENLVAAYDGSKRVGNCEYAAPGSFWIITHTTVDPEYGGQGIAGALVDGVMREAEKAGVKVKPFCSYAAKLFQKNPAYAEQEDHSVITVYGMPTCPDCAYVEGQIADNPSFRFVDIGEHVKNLKAFLRVRDSSPVFDDAKENGYAGIPCFVLADGTVALSPEAVGLQSKPAEGTACRLDGSGC